MSDKFIQPKSTALQNFLQGRNTPTALSHINNPHTQWYYLSLNVLPTKILKLFDIMTLNNNRDLHNSHHFFCQSMKSTVLHIVAGLLLGCMGTAGTKTALQHLCIYNKLLIYLHSHENTHQMIHPQQLDVLKAPNIKSPDRTYIISDL